MFWCLEEWQGRNKERRKEGLKMKTEWVRVWRRNLVGKKKGKKEEERNVVWRIKKEWKKKEKKIMKYYHNFFTINFKESVIIS